MAPLEDPSQFGRLLGGLQDLYASSLLTDVTLVAGDVQVKCHRNVLATSSAYFRAMFCGNLKESALAAVELHEVSSAVLRPLINYVYCGMIDLSDENVQDLFLASNHLEMIELRDLCSQYIMEEICVSNCIPLYRFATMHKDDNLIKVTKTFIVKWFSDLAKTGELYDLEYEDFLEFISCDDLDIKSEEIVFYAVERWVEKDLIARKKHLTTLLKAVRLGLLSEKFMTTVVEACDLIGQDPFCRSVIKLARLQVLAKGTNIFDVEDSVEDDICKKRFGMHLANLVTFVGASTKKDVKGLGCFDPKTMKNYFAISPQIGFDYTYRIDYHRAVVTRGNLIFVVGGILYENYELTQSGESTKDVCLFDPDTKTWLNREPLTDRRCAHALVSLDRWIYAIGGKSIYPQGDPLSSVEIYNIDKDSWENGTELPVPLCHHQAVVHRDTILVLGGTTTNDIVLDSILRYRPASHTWDTFPLHLEFPRAEFGATLRGDTIFIAGGTNGEIKLSTVETINITDEKWNRISDFPEDRKSPAVFTLDNEVYLCGGTRTILIRSTMQHKEVTSRDLWRYDESENTWVQEAKLLPYANTHAYVMAEHNVKKLIESDFVSKK